VLWTKPLIFTDFPLIRENCSRTLADGFQELGMSRLTRATAGFSLIEIAIVLAVIGILLSGGLLAISPIVQQSKITETKARIARVETAIQAYVIANGCLPCPAAGNSDSTINANAGRAEVGGGPNLVVCAGGCDLTQGVVPWQNLGLSEADVTDAYGNRLTYAARSLLCASGTGMLRTGSSYPAGDITVNNAAGAVTDEAAYVILSHGPDGANAFAAETGRVRNDGRNSPTQNENSEVELAGSVVFNQLPNNSIDNTTYFDDILEFRTAPIIIQGCGAGSCGNPG